MHRLIVGCLILITILVACGGDTEEVTEADALRARLAAIEATLASSGEVPTGTPSLTTPLTLTPTPATVQAPTPRPLTSPLAPKPTASAQTAGPDAIRARQAELRAAEAAAADIATRWAERQLLFDSCMDTELGEAEYAELLGFETGSSEWTNFLAIAIEGPLSYTRQGMLADHSWWRQAAGMATATPVPGPSARAYGRHAHIHKHTSPYRRTTNAGCHGRCDCGACSRGHAGISQRYRVARGSRTTAL